MEVRTDIGGGQRKDLEQGIISEVTSGLALACQVFLKQVEQEREKEWHVRIVGPFGAWGQLSQGLEAR